MPSAWTVSDPNLINAPPGWGIINALLGEFRSPESFGFRCLPGDLNRFWSRYRLAKSFRGMNIDGYSTDTIRGYTALFEFFLVWSAFEQFMRVCSLKINAIEPILESYNVDALTAAIRHVPDNASFLNAVREQLKYQRHRDQIQAFLREEPCDIIIVAAGIRHVFAHGRITPNSGVGNVNGACAITGLFKNFLFSLMDREFVARLESKGIRVTDR